MEHKKLRFFQMISMWQVFVLLALFLHFGCNPTVEQDDISVPFGEFSQRTFATDAHIMDENSFSVIEKVGLDETKLCKIHVFAEQNRLRVKSIVFPHRYDDIAFWPATNKFLGFRTPRQSSNEVSWLTAAGSEQKIELESNGKNTSLPDLKRCLILGVFPSTSAFALWSFGRGEEENRVLLYQMRDMDEVFLESEVNIDFSRGAWALSASSYCDEQRNLFGTISPDGFPRIWRILTSGYEEISKAPLEYKPVSFKDKGGCRAAVSPGYSYLAVSRDNIVGRDKTDLKDPLEYLYCDLCVWSLESGKIIYELEDVPYQKSMSIEFIDEYTILLIGTDVYSFVDIQSPTASVVEMPVAPRTRVYETRMLSDSTILRVGLTQQGHNIEIEYLDEVLKKRINKRQ